MGDKPRLTMDSSVGYRICVQGHLDRSWSERLGGIVIQVLQETGDAPVTVLTGTIIDQAALAGVLDTLYSLGFPLLSVEVVDVRPAGSIQNADASISPAAPAK